MHTNVKVVEEIRNFIKIHHSLRECVLQMDVCYHVSMIMIRSAQDLFLQPINVNFVYFPQKFCTSPRSGSV